MGHNADHGRTADPLSMITQGMRRMSALRLEDITRGFENFANPSARGMLESMGRTREEQIATMAGLLRNSSEADIEEMGQVFGLAMAKLAEDRANGAPVGGPVRSPERHPDRPRRRNHSAAEWRRQRHLGRNEG